MGWLSFLSGCGPKDARSGPFESAQTGSFAVLEAGYAADAGPVYFQGALLTREAASFRVLGLGYARTDTRVYYAGRPVADADPKTFALLPSPTENTDAKDARRPYQQGRPVRGIIRP